MRGAVRSVVLGICLAALAGSASARFRMIRMRTPDAARLESMRASGAYELVEIEGDTATFIEDLEQLQELGRDERVQVQLQRGAYRIEQQDLDDVFASFRAKGSEGAYHSVEEVEAEIQAVAEAHPDRVSILEIGRSIEDRPIHAVKVSENDGVARPAVIFMGMIHAREWISTEMAMAFLDAIVDPSEDLAPTLQQLDVYLIPVLNPDGLIYSQSEYRWWRGNRRLNENGRYGVDLNRNFSTGWGIGSSSYPGSQTYRGASPLSEPEAKAFDDLVASVKPVATMTWHAYGRMVLLPFGYQRKTPARWDVYEELGPAMKAATGNRYSQGPIHQLIGVVGGATDDHFLVEHGAFVCTLELGTSFIPPEDQIEPILAEALPASLVWLKAAPGLAGIDPRVPASEREKRFRSLH